MALIVPRRAVLTGAPGAGKSSLLDELGRRGFIVSQEVARAILQAPGGMDLRAKDPVGFAWAMLEAQEATYTITGVGLPQSVIFDRGFADIAAFLELSGLPLLSEVDAVCRRFRFDGPIFRAPPWKAIFTQDAERIQTWEQAVRSDDAVTRAWQRYGYEVIDLPFASIEDRAAFVMAKLTLP